MGKNIEIFPPLITGVLILAGSFYLSYLTAQRFRLFRLEAKLRLQFLAKDYPVALSTISQALRLDPCSVSLYQTRARVYLELGDYLSAELDYSRAIRFNQNATSYAGRAASRLGQNNPAQALLDANHAIACSRTWWRGYFERGRAYILLGYYQLALEDFEQVLEFNHNPGGDFFIARAAAYQGLQNSEAARLEVVNAQNLNPNLKANFQPVRATFNLNYSPLSD